ncbi:MAG: nicotinate-nucleotide--dimethylbenzimidazole phosphoribosyltransferase [Desulfovibrionaceae bacterium]|nr:nicotinate-nucleotide--dimethylbenzimidazole phosphoribosyltransferase [Desulfovibrionaceae bacterium]
MHDPNTLLSSLDPALSLQTLDAKLIAEAQNHIDSLAKPLGSLGRLEEIAARLYAIQQGRMPLSVNPIILFTVAADHGISAHNVSAYPKEVTRQMVSTFLNGSGAINIISRENGITHCLVDAGCAGGPFPIVPNPILLDRRLGDGTADFSAGPAMTRETAKKGLAQGIQLVRDAANEGCQCTAIGEMGIGNTTSATALFCALLDLDPMLITGPGTGLTEKGRIHKACVIRDALALHAESLREGDAIDALARLGGFEIATMAGIVLGSAAERLPVLIDGFIAMSAYTVARALAPCVTDYAFLTHTSAEPGTAAVLNALNEHPLLDLGLRLGEGTGAALAYPLFQAAAALFNDMASLARAGIPGKKDVTDD